MQFRIVIVLTQTSADAVRILTQGLLPLSLSIRLAVGQVAAAFSLVGNSGCLLGAILTTDTIVAAVITSIVSTVIAAVIREIVATRGSDRFACDSRCADATSC